MSYWLSLVCIVVLFSCAGRNAEKKKETTVNTFAQKNEVKYVNSVKILSPEKDAIYRFGDEVQLAFDCKERFDIDSSAVYANGKLQAKLGKNVRECLISLPADKAGTLSIKVEVWHPGNKCGVASLSLQVKPNTKPVRYDYEVLNVYPHDKNAYTQGLLFWDGFLYEGTGQYGESSLRKTDLKSGKSLAVLNIASEYFGEGITVFDDKLYQLTWRSRKGFVYDLRTFSLESSFDYFSEGWGITTMNDHLVMSDGSHKLYHISPSTFNIIKEVEVYDWDGEVSMLNELEYVDGLIWANVWMTDRIVAINPNSGVVVADLDLSGLLSKSDKAALDDDDDVLNGIAWNPNRKTFYVTGKRWPKLFEIKLKKD